MKFPVIPVSVVGFAILAGCSPPDSSSPGLVMTDSAGIVLIQNTISDGTPVCEVAELPSLTIGEADGPPEYQFYRTFGAKRLSDGSIAVVNQGTQELRFYDSDGVFLKAVGGEGEGPGRFRRAFTLSILPGDSLWVGDYDPWEWEVFSPEGTWVRGVRPVPALSNASAMGVLDSGMFVTAPGTAFHAPVGTFAPESLTVFLHSPQGFVIDTVGSFDNGRFGRFEESPRMVISPMFDSSTRISIGGNRIVNGHTSRGEFRVLDVGEHPSPERIVRWNAPERAVRKEDVEAERARILESAANLSEAMRQEMVAPQLSDQRLVAETFPVFSQIELARDGRIWVRTYQLPGESDLREWLIFAADGTLQCRVEVPAFEQMPDFGSDYILVMRRDDLGVERIFMYELGAPIMHR